MLAGNTAWMFPNTTRKPLNDRVFRRALASSINVNRIVDGRLRQHRHQGEPDRPAADLEQVRRQERRQAVRLLVQHHQGEGDCWPGPATRTSNGDGFVENKDGSRINLNIIVPNGWSDWMTAIQIISDSAKDAGIRITPAYPDYNTLVDDRGHGRYDLVIGNDRQLSNTPWTYYDYLFRLPIRENQTTVNYERYTNPTAWKLTQQLDRTPTSNQAAMKSMMSQAADDLPHGPAGDSALVQRRLGAVEHRPSGRTGRRPRARMSRTARVLARTTSR